MEVSNNSLDFQIHESQIFATELSEFQRPRSSSILRERTSNSTNSQSSVNNTTSIQHTSTNNSNTTNTTDSFHQNEHLQRNNRVMYCRCGFESVLREVKKDTVNRGRHFWSCSKFGGPNHAERCNFFRWDNPISNDDDDAMAESSSSAQNRFNNRSEMPYVLIESANINIENNNNDENETSDDDDDDDDDEVNLTPGHEHPSDNEETRVSTITTPPTTPHRRSRNSTVRVSSPQPIPTPARHGTDVSIIDVPGNNRSLTGDIYTRSPAVFNNWSNVPKFSTPQLLDIMQNHLVKQDKNYQKWFTATQSAKKELEEAKKEVEKLKRDLEVISRENKLNRRENEVLKAEKRLLQHENDVLKEENRELKRRRF